MSLSSQSSSAATTPSHWLSVTPPPADWSVSHISPIQSHPLISASTDSSTDSRQIRQSMKPTTLVLSLILGALPAATGDQSYKLHHRIHHVLLGHLPYAERGTVHIAHDGSTSFLSAPTLSTDLATFSQSITNIDGPLDTLYYQMALQRGDEPQSSWDFTSIKACHLPQVISQTIILHIQGAQPFAMDYFVSPIPLDGSCPKSSRSKSSVAPLSPFTAFADNVRGLNTTILLKSAQHPPLYEVTPLSGPVKSLISFPRPELRKPQPITPTGQPIEPVQEKSFIQKYWMYIAVALVALLLTGGEEEGPRRQARV